MLDNADYVVAIIPDSFVQNINLFRDHIFAIDRQSKVLFEDTDEPLCVAYFVKNCNKDFVVYSDGNPFQTYSELCKSELTVDKTVDITFNDPDGEIGLIAFDNTKEASIRFVRGEELHNKNITQSSRHYTRISGIPNYTDNIDTVIEISNGILRSYRDSTQDFFLTAFKGMRKDGKLRRRLDFKKARIILSIAVSWL